MATLTTVRSDILFAIDETSAAWATPTEVNRMIDRAYRAGWDILIQKHEDYACDPKDFTIAAGASSHVLIADTPAGNQIARAAFYKLRMLMRKGTDSKFHPIESFTLEESESLDGFGYMFMGDTLYVEPTEAAPGDYRAWYIPQITPLSGEADPLKDPVAGGIEQYTIDVVSARLKAKDELDPSAYTAFAEALEERIARMGAHRNAGRPRKVSDVRGTRMRFRTRRAWW